jgi:hypothetical protein
MFSAMDEATKPNSTHDPDDLRAELRRMSLDELRHFGRLCIELERRNPADVTNTRQLELARQEFGRRQIHKSRSKE